MAAEGPDSARLASIEHSVTGISNTLDKLVRAVQGEIDAGNVGLVRRVTNIEKRIDAELEKAATVHDSILSSAAAAHKEIEASIVGLKIKMAGYGFIGSLGGGGLLVAIIQLAENTSS